MRREVDNFTRGSQLISHKFMMFRSGVGLLLIIHLLIVLVSSSGWMWATTTEHEQYLAWMRLEAYGWRYFELDPSKEMFIQTQAGHILTMTWAQALTHPVLTRAWVAVATALNTGMWFGSFVGGVFVSLGWYVSKRVGLSAKRDRDQRGAELCTRKQLIAEIRLHNQRAWSRAVVDLLKAVRPARWWLQYPFITSSLWAREGQYLPLSLAGVPYPWGTETFHTMLCGTTGSGKTTAIMDLMRQVRRHGHRAVVFDLTGAFVGAFHDPDRDLILNSHDARCPVWSVFHDAETDNDFTQIANAIIPHDGGGQEPFWVNAARMLFVEACLKLHAAGHRTNQALADELMTVPLAKVEALLANTPAAPFTSTDAARMAESVRSTLNVNAKALLAMPTDGPPLSIRHWIGARDHDGFLFLATRPNQMETTRRLLTVWMDIAIQALMSGTPQRTVQIFFFFDEVGALHSLPGLEQGLQTARNYGGAFVLGVHAYSKLADTYGDKRATVISSLTRTKLILSTADRQTAEWCSDFIGRRQYHEMSEGLSYGYSQMRDAVTLTAQLRTEPLVLPDSITNLPSLSGYVKFAEGFPAAPIRLTYVTAPEYSPRFIPRRVSPPGTRPNPGLRVAEPAAPFDADASGANHAGDAPPDDGGVAQDVAMPPAPYTRHGLVRHHSARKARKSERGAQTAGVPLMAVTPRGQGQMVLGEPNLGALADQIAATLASSGLHAAVTRPTEPLPTADPSDRPTLSPERRSGPMHEERLLPALSDRHDPVTGAIIPDIGLADE